MSEDSKIDAAMARFEDSLRRLEQAVSAAKMREEKAVASSGEAEALRSDRSQLAQELDEVRAKAKDLADVNRQAATRVRAAMKRLKAVIEA